MIMYGSIYLIAKDFEKSISFYKALFEKDVHAQNKTRFAVFDTNGLWLAIMNGRFDVEHPDEVLKKESAAPSTTIWNRLWELPTVEKWSST